MKRKKRKKKHQLKKRKRMFPDPPLLPKKYPKERRESEVPSLGPKTPQIQSSTLSKNWKEKEL